MIYDATLQGENLRCCIFILRKHIDNYLYVCYKYIDKYLCEVDKMNTREVALICKALSDNNRLQIVQMLSDGEKCGCKLKSDRSHVVL